MMAANVAPALVGSTIKDANGNNLSDKARLKAERRKRLKNELDEMQTAQDKALEAYKKSKELDKAVFDKKQEYNKALADVED